jgi:hypothetical protein
MARVTELQVRGDWQLIRFFYLPAAAVGLVPFEPCALCIFCFWWGHHLEEWARSKPLFRITDDGLRYEDGGKPVRYHWCDITMIALHRRSSIPLWRTNGSLEIGTPRFWLEISVRQRGNQVRRICVWPRQVVGGLFSLTRFARELQRKLIAVADGGGIPSLLPRKTTAA